MNDLAEYQEMVMAGAKAEAVGNAMQGILLLPPGTNINAIEPSLAERADRWMHSPGGRHVMRDLYALAAKYARDWRRDRGVQAVGRPSVDADLRRNESGGHG